MAVLQFPRTLPATRNARALTLGPVRLPTPLSVATERPATTEPIWGIPSRHSLMERLRTLGELAPAVPLSFLAVELRGLYLVDAQAPETGFETLLHAVATQLPRLARATDMVGRLGLSSFGVILQGVGATAAAGVAARLSLHLNQLAVAWPGSEVRVAAATGTGVNALVLPSAAQDIAADCC